MVFGHQERTRCRLLVDKSLEIEQHICVVGTSEMLILTPFTAICKPPIKILREHPISIPRGDRFGRGQVEGFEQAAAKDEKRGIPVSRILAGDCGAEKEKQELRFIVALFQRSLL